MCLYRFFGIVGGLFLFELDGSGSGRFLRNCVGELWGELYGEVWGEEWGEIFGDVNGEFFGEFLGEFFGEFYGECRGEDFEDVFGELNGDVCVIIRVGEVGDCRLSRWFRFWGKGGGVFFVDLDCLLLFFCCKCGYVLFCWEE